VLSSTTANNNDGSVDKRGIVFVSPSRCLQWRHDSLAQPAALPMTAAVL